MKIKNEYTSSDFALIAALSLFQPIERIDRKNLKRITFTFKKNKKLLEIIDSYWQGELKVDPLKYFTQLKNIKTRIYSNG